MSRVGPFTLEERIDEDRGGHVFRARGPDGDAIALKTLGPIERGGAVDVAAFERVARQLEALTHPHLVRVLAHGVDPERGPYVAMPLLRGMTLADVFPDRARLAPEAALVLLYPIVDALAALHAKGLVHGDVRPESVFLGVTGEVTLVDPALSPQAHERPVTGPKLAYAPPERLEGRELDPASDVWSVGVMLYELIAGRRPFADRAAILAARFDPLGGLEPRVSAELDWLIGVTLAREPWGRPRDAQTLLDRMSPHVAAPIDALRAERVAVLSGHEAYARRIASAVIGSAHRAAERAREEGDADGAARHLTRALAYRPGDEATLALLAAARAAERAPATTDGRASRAETRRPRSVPDEPRGRAHASSGASSRARALRRAAAIAAVVGALGVGGAIVLHATREPPRTPVAAPAPEVAPEPVEAPSPPPFQRVLLRPETLPEEGPAAPEELARVTEAWIAADTAASRSRSPSAAGSAAGPPLDPLPEGGGAERSDSASGSASHAATRALALLAGGQGRQARRALEALERDAPAALALLRMREGRFEEADALFTRALERAPDDPRIRTRRGVMRLGQGRPRDAYVDLDAALARAPDDAEALAAIARVHLAIGRAEEAGAILRRSVELDPTRADAWAWLARALGRGPSHADEAIAAAERALAIEPRHAGALEESCLLLARFARPGAVALCNVAIQERPTDARLFVARGRELSRTGQHRPALADADRAIELAPEEPAHRYERALFKERAGDAAGAETDLRAACGFGHAGACHRLRGVP